MDKKDSTASWTISPLMHCGINILHTYSIYTYQIYAYRYIEATHDVQRSAKSFACSHVNDLAKFYFFSFFYLFVWIYICICLCISVYTFFPRFTMQLLSFYIHILISQTLLSHLYIVPQGFCIKLAPVYSSESSPFLPQIIFSNPHILLHICSCDVVYYDNALGYFK